MTSTHTLTIGATPFAVHTRGSGIPLLLLHAFPLDHSMLDAQEPLADAVRIIAPDQRGFGATPGEPTITSIGAMADDAVAVLDALHVSRGSARSPTRRAIAHTPCDRPHSVRWPTRRAEHATA